MKSFRVPRREVHVRVLLHSGEELEGNLYAPSTGPDGLPGRLEDRLNDTEESFLPLAGKHSRYLLHKSWVVTVQFGSDEPGDGDDLDQEGSVRHRVRVGLAQGLALDGTLHYAMPPERSRLLDFLNAAPRFFPLDVDGRLNLINRDFVVRVHQLEAFE